MVLADSSLEVGFSPAMHMATASWPYHALPVDPSKWPTRIENGSSAIRKLSSPPARHDRLPAESRLLFTDHIREYWIGKRCGVRELSPPSSEDWLAL
jgi:hypothetical protein